MIRGHHCQLNTVDYGGGARTRTCACACLARMIDWLRAPRNSPFEATLRCPPSTLLPAHHSQHFKPPVLFRVRVIPFKWTPPTRYTSCSDRQLFVYAVGKFNGYIVFLLCIWSVCYRKKLGCENNYYAFLILLFVFWWSTIIIPPPISPTSLLTIIL